jgi:hypothetical protein
MIKRLTINIVETEKGIRLATRENPKDQKQKKIFYHPKNKFKSFSEAFIFLISSEYLSNLFKKEKDYFENKESDK